VTPGRCAGFVLALLLALPALAEEPPVEFLRDFVAGTYTLVGRAADSDATYSGTVRIAPGAPELVVTRELAGGTVSGAGAIESATADAVPVLRVRFREGEAAWEATYLIAGDLDNRARLSGYLYRTDGSTRVPGLETLFAAPAP